MARPVKKESLSQEIAGYVAVDADTDFKNRAINATNEINQILEKNKVTLIAQFEYTPGGIVPKVTIANMEDVIN